MTELEPATSVRTRPASETLALATRLMPSLGISRVSDITRMDRLGLPVFASIRPRGLALCVNAGKGMNPMDARVGALMEAVEFAAAEPQRGLWCGRPWRMSDLESEWNGELSRAALGPRIDLTLPADHVIQAMRCEDIGGGRAMWLPAELVFMPFGDDPSQLPYGWSSNGLASGNSVDEATVHAILEVLERDALAMHAVRDESLWLAPDCLPEEYASLVSRWMALGMELSVRLLPNDFGLPCFRVLLHEAGDAAIGLAEGSGLHQDAGIALSRAICEAAQSRLSHIHGGRDDITRFYDRFDRNNPERAPVQETLAYREAFDTTRQVSWNDVPSEPCSGVSIAGVLEGLISRLRARGFRQVLRHRFALDLGGLNVVKVVVPGCELIDRRLERVGPRMLARVRLLHA